MTDQFEEAIERGAKGVEALCGRRTRSSNFGTLRRSRQQTDSTCPNCGSHNIAADDRTKGLDADERECQDCWEQWAVNDDGSIALIYDLPGRGHLR